MEKQPTILIVGAGGFIGGFIAQRALELGYDTYVGIRHTTSRRRLGDERLHIVEFDYDDAVSVRDTLAAAAPASGHWDYIIWNLGATKCTNPDDFDRINYGYLRDFVKALRANKQMPERFLFMSSLSALGRGDEKGYTPLSDETEPNPDTLYGLSKIKAELLLEQVPELNWVIFRPTGVYGPEEKDYLMMIKSIDRGIDVGMGYRPQLLTFIYVEDLVDAMFKALAADERVVHKKYIISEPRAYTQKQFRDIVAARLGRRHVMALTLPMWAVYGVSTISEKIGAMTGKPSTLNRDKFKIMRQRNWACDVSPAARDFGFMAQTDLVHGIDRTVAAYLAKKG